MIRSLAIILAAASAVMLTMLGAFGSAATGAMQEGVSGTAPGAATGAAPVEAAPQRFETLDIYIDSGTAALAAYQVEIRAAGGHAQLVGVEGGNAAAGGTGGAYSHPPYYDPKALHGDQLSDRIIIAALGDPQSLPTGRTRVARLHIAVRGEAEYQVTLQAAGSTDGQRISAQAEVKPLLQTTPTEQNR